MSEHKMMSLVAVPALTGGIAYLGTKSVFKGLASYPDKVKWRNQSYDAAMVSGAANAAGALAVEMAHEWFFPLIPGHEKWTEPVSLAAAVGVQTGVNVAFHNYLNSRNLREVGLGKMAMVSAASYLLASGAWEKFILPSLAVV